MTSTKSPSKRVLQLAEDIRGVVANLFARGEVRDPRLQGITIHHVKLSSDLSVAKVYYMIPQGSDKDEIAKLLKPVSRYVRKALGDQLFLRYIPQVNFYYDDNIDHSMKINELLSKI